MNKRKRKKCLEIRNKCPICGREIFLSCYSSSDYIYREHHCPKHTFYRVGNKYIWDGEINGIL